MNQSYDQLLTSLKGLARELDVLHQQSARALAPVVERLITTRSGDVPCIERTLDRLLDCACHPDGLALIEEVDALQVTVEAHLATMGFAV